MSAASASVALTAAPTLEPDAVFSATERDVDEPSSNVGALFAAPVMPVVEALALLPEPCASVYETEARR